MILNATSCNSPSSGGESSPVPVVGGSHQTSRVQNQEVIAVGAYGDVSAQDEQVLKAAAFAVEAQSKVERSSIEFQKVLSASSQVVAGMNYRMELQVMHKGQVKTAEAVVYHQAWVKRPYQLTTWTWK